MNTHAIPERVVQLCHPDLHNEFPPLRLAKTIVAHNLPAQLTSFVGRGAQIKDVQQILADNRLVTLTGAGGVGKTRLAVQIAAEMTGEFDDGVWYVDLAPITDPDAVPVALARALNVHDQLGRSTIDTLTRYIDARQMLLLLDNCEHLLDASAALIIALLSACPGLALLATSREPIGAAGEVIWRVPSLSLGDEAVELFSARARRVRPGFSTGGDNAATVIEICRRLDGMPLAIELAAARMRALSLTEIVDGLHDRFRLLTGGARTAVRRQQTLRASVDWSHALLTDPERVLFRRLAVFMGGFDLDAAQAVGGGGDVERYPVLDQLSLLVDKSLVVAENTTGRTRYRLLETMRQYALEKLGESGEADAVRACHRDYYTSVAARLDSPALAGHDRRIEHAETEIDNLRAAFAWSREQSDVAPALGLASSLWPLWLARGPVQEGLAWFDAVLTDENMPQLDVAPAVRTRAIADKALLAAGVMDASSLDQAKQALAVAREIDDSALLVRALIACGSSAAHNAEVARQYFAEAIPLARATGDRWMLSLIHDWQAFAALTAGDPIAARAAAEDGDSLAGAIGDAFVSRSCRWRLGIAKMFEGDLAAAVAHFREVVAEAQADNDVLFAGGALLNQGQALAYHGDTSAARAAANAALEAAAELGDIMEGFAYAVLALAGLAAGDVAAAADASEAAWQRLSVWPELAAINVNPMAEVALARGDLIRARRWADDAVSATTGWHLASALTTRARVAIAQGEPEQAERDAHDALARAARTGSHQALPDILECLAGLGADGGSYREATRLFGAADAIRQRIGVVRFQAYQAGYTASVAAVRHALGDDDFDAAWAEGAALSTDETIAYAQRGRGERKRPASGWAWLTPTERDVVRLVSEGLANKDIATRLFVSPRTVSTHLTHVYTKLGLTSRVLLVQEAGRHT